MQVDRLMRKLLTFAGIIVVAFNSIILKADSKSANTKILCGTLFDSKKGTFVTNKLITVSGKKIETITDAPQNLNADVVDLSGEVCFPGWIDLHVHLSADPGPTDFVDEFRLDPERFAIRSVRNARRTLLAGFTTVRDLGDAKGHVTRALRDTINENRIPGPRILISGAQIGSSGGHADLTNGLSSRYSKLIKTPGPAEGIINSIDDARQAVRERYKERADVIKITATGGVLSYAANSDGPQLTTEEISAIVDTAKDYGMRVTAHAHGKTGMTRAIIAGVHSIEHGTYLDPEAADLMVEHGTWLIPTLMAGEYTVKMSKVDGFFPEVIRKKAAVIGLQSKKMFELAYKKGVKIALGSDAGVSDHGTNARELELMTEYGMTGAEAFQAATFSAAQVLGRDDIGELKKGALADMVALDETVLKDMSQVHKVALVMKEGRIYKANYEATGLEY